MGDKLQRLRKRPIVSLVNCSVVEREQHPRQHELDKTPIRGEPLASFLIGILNLRGILLGLEVKLIVKENLQPKQPSGPGDLKNRLNSIQPRIGGIGR
jgi:hypothetical protein